MDVTVTHILGSAAAAAAAAAAGAAADPLGPAPPPVTVTVSSAATAWSAFKEAADSDNAVARRVATQWLHRVGCDLSTGWLWKFG
jgi:hypothetical protein